MRVLAALVSILTIGACGNGQYTHQPGGPFYFETFVDNYSIPYTPKNEISKAEAESRKVKGASYCIAYFNHQGLVSSFEKRLGGKLFFHVQYVYTDGRLAQQRVVNSDGQENVFTY